MDKQRAITLLCQMYLPHFNDEEKEALSMGIEALEQTRNDEWISVKDRLPKEDVEVLAQLEWDAIDIVWYSNNEWCREFSNLEDGDVLYWQPLPQLK